MAQYIIYFHQQWVGEHSEDWFRSRGPLARAVVERMRAAGVYVFAGGVDEDLDAAVTADATSGTLVLTKGPYGQGDQLGGLTIIDVPDHGTAVMWAGEMAEACGWPQTVRRVV